MEARWVRRKGRGVWKVAGVKREDVYGGIFVRKARNGVRVLDGSSVWVIKLIYGMMCGLMRAV